MSTDKDIFGHYQTSLNWKFSELDWHTLNEAIKYCASTFIDNKLGLLKIDNLIINNDTFLPADLRGGQHHSGTTRMGSSQNTGVVDSSLKVYEMKNLYTVGSSVFPTNGWVKPTFTIIALSLRLSDQIEKQ